MEERKMGAKIPEQIAESDLSRLLSKAGLLRTHQGKVRNTYELPGHPDLLLPVATDRLSIFDFVLPCLIKDKGKILTALTVFWLEKALQNFKHHLVAYGKGIDQYLPAEIRNLPELQARALVVEKLSIIPYEYIVRGYLTGSGLIAYEKEGKVCGYQLPQGLHDGSKLSEPFFAPTTKAESGHDEHITASEVEAMYGKELENLSLEIYRKISSYALERGIIVADTKFEFGEDNTIGDEIATPDSSRFWDEEEWKQASRKKRSPSNYDKEIARKWGKTIKTSFKGGNSKEIVGINKLSLENPAHIDFVHGLKVPEEILSLTVSRYHEIFERLTGLGLEAFQKEIMGI